MNCDLGHERELLLRQLGASEERVRRLERTLAELKTACERDAREWQRLLRHRIELADWLVDMATDASGRIVKTTLEAGLRGESFVPCSFHADVNGKRYRFELVTTQYEIHAAPEQG
jgi:hypothetical protein